MSKMDPTRLGCQLTLHHLELNVSEAWTPCIYFRPGGMIPPVNQASEYPESIFAPNSIENWPELIISYVNEPIVFPK